MPVFSRSLTAVGASMFARSLRGQGLHPTALFNQLLTSRGFSSTSSAGNHAADNSEAGRHIFQSSAVKQKKVNFTDVVLNPAHFNKHNPRPESLSDNKIQQRLKEIESTLKSMNTPNEDVANLQLESGYLNLIMTGQGLSGIKAGADLIQSKRLTNLLDAQWARDMTLVGSLFLKGKDFVNAAKYFTDIFFMRLPLTAEEQRLIMEKTPKNLMKEPPKDKGVVDESPTSLIKLMLLSAKAFCGAGDFQKAMALYNLAHIYIEIGLVIKGNDLEKNPEYITLIHRFQDCALLYEVTVLNKKSPRTPLHDMEILKMACDKTMGLFTDMTDAQKLTLKEEADATVLAITQGMRAQIESQENEKVAEETSGMSMR